MKNIMKKFAFLSIAICFAFLLTAPVNAQDIIKANITSRVLGQERPIGIVLPKGYDAKSKTGYPVVYILDSFKPISTAFAKSSGPEVILVGIVSINETREADLLPPYMRSDIEKASSPMGKGDKFLEFIETELMLYVNKNYATSGVNALTGHSRGGVFVLYSVLAKPGLFQARFAFSPALWREDDIIVGKTKEFLASADKNKSLFYMSMGDAEVDKMKNSFNRLTEAVSKDEKKITWHSEYTKTANHQTNVELSISRAIEKWKEYLKNKTLFVSADQSSPVARLMRKTWPSGWRTCISRTFHSISVRGNVTSRPCSRQRA